MNILSDSKKRSRIMEKQTVHLFVFDTLSDWEPAFAIAAINNPAFQAHPGRYRVKTVGVSTDPVTTIGGVTILPDMTLDELMPAQSAMLILSGGAGWEKGEHAEALEKAQQFLAAGVPVAAICGATAGLALAGILDDKQHTSNWLGQLKAVNYQGEALYQNLPAVTDGNVITAGATASLEFAYQILKKLEVYNDQTLEAWYGLYKTGDPAYFFALQ
jgi:putative intracellular protease/amidase